MRKLALMLAAALIMSAPMLATAPTDSFAAAKEKKKAEAGQPKGFFDALGDNLAGKGGGENQECQRGGAHPSAK